MKPLTAIYLYYSMWASVWGTYIGYINTHATNALYIENYINKQRRDTLMKQSIKKGVTYGVLWPVTMPLSTYRKIKYKGLDVWTTFPCEENEMRGVLSRSIARDRARRLSEKLR